ncbi:hypothetical protein PTTG_03694 [Puccinia triticina 1-1 BBBD Race 1]|uniref:Uncharacterized protein n=1 Tax=Puccinia triticina (isolate 1-1 / race 1 (BBBD)) TaxID=630390 RepID=A0A180GHK0_PUCT1|nr:hypothetical protein PTTG_03694 [Puccinia triticina 1-1 BBBD Race 1]
MAGTPLHINIQHQSPSFRPHPQSLIYCQSQGPPSPIYHIQAIIITLPTFLTTQSKVTAEMRLPATASGRASLSHFAQLIIVACLCASLLNAGPLPTPSTPLTLSTQTSYPQSFSHFAKRNIVNLEEETNAVITAGHSAAETLNPTRGSASAADKVPATTDSPTLGRSTSLPNPSSHNWPNVALKTNAAPEVKGTTASPTLASTGSASQTAKTEDATAVVSTQNDAAPPPAAVVGTQHEAAPEAVVDSSVNPENDPFKLGEAKKIATTADTNSLPQDVATSHSSPTTSVAPLGEDQYPINFSKTPPLGEAQFPIDFSPDPKTNVVEKGKKIVNADSNGASTDAEKSAQQVTGAQTTGNTPEEQVTGTQTTPKTAEVQESSRPSTAAQTDRLEEKRPPSIQVTNLNGETNSPPTEVTTPPPTEVKAAKTPTDTAAKSTEVPHESIAPEQAKEPTRWQRLKDRSHKEYLEARARRQRFTAWFSAKSQSIKKWIKKRFFTQKPAKDQQTKPKKSLLRKYLKKLRKFLGLNRKAKKANKANAQVAPEAAPHAA